MSAFALFDQMAVMLPLLDEKGEYPPPCGNPA
jgi:hypothetical protein